MTYHSFLNEIVAYGAFAALACVTLTILMLFILLRRDVQRRLQAMSKTVRKTEEECRRAITTMEEMIRNRPPEPVQAPPEKAVELWAAPPRVEERKPQPHEVRNRVIEMSRAGMEPATIATALCMRENEVKLMLKVHNALRSCFSAN
jgi:hypothetical protein